MGADFSLLFGQAHLTAKVFGFGYQTHSYLIDKDYTLLLKQTVRDFIDSFGNESIDLRFFSRGLALSRPGI